VDCDQQYRLVPCVNKFILCLSGKKMQYFTVVVLSNGITYAIYPYAVKSHLINECIFIVTAIYVVYGVDICSLHPEAMAY